MEENILVCAANYQNAEKLINKGVQLAKALGGACFVLTVDHISEENEYEKSREIAMIKMLAKECQVPFLFEPSNGRKVCDIIAAAVEKNNIQHVILGQPVQSRWDMLVKGSLVNDLFSRLENVDLTIVEVNPWNIPGESDYEKGTLAYIVKQDGKYTLSLEKPLSYELEGIFFQSTKTDFQTGLFKSKYNNEAFLLKVIDGEVKWPYKQEIS
ncbi:two-component system, OmpR family, sensor histidine kinase KdpD [Evansella caseinilytica]|uniref:Two-component system, OmpR family, sensor histidine kinase KdpD n=1 Tax=Evansella caseinilytica TaxID=1503961 RepID=A0A1H3HCS8_9BACI|nr:hypothetical protein [Evansella caseinilytica]SDY13130.1 two-component system, OmpR family, sensor histidine kinase KdpD [Evansella caseinilytica]